ncbi:MAG: 3'-5' exonuclease [Chloroflexi bacterium]|nr:3'-5' exonuclease [Chloroflexota bacterium]
MVHPFVVIDCETTGLGRNDRIVEIAAVTLDASTKEVTSEYTTLLNPQCDVGPVDIHGVTSAMVETAPVFEEIAGALATRLDGAVLVAHNLPFDSRMIAQEFERLGTQFAPGKGICTLKATSAKLSVACARYGIELTAHHCALADARATAALMKRCIKTRPVTMPASIGRVPWVANSRTLSRERR